MRDYYVYFLTNWTNESMYVGMTNNLERRVYEHKSQLVSGHTKKYNLQKLVYYEVCCSAEDAIRREKQIKTWRRDKKDKLVEAMNPKWNDLSDGWRDRSLGYARDDNRGGV